MHKLIFKYTVAILIISFWYLLIVYADMRNDVLGNESNYLAAMIDKTEILKKSNSGKILLLGGSNLAFGVDSDKINSLTKKNVVNMGLHAGIGLNFLFNLTEKYIYEGDIVILSPEYNYFIGHAFYGDSNLVDTLYYMPEYGKLIIGFQQIYSIIDKNIYRNNKIRNRGLINIFRKREFVKDVYYREGFNKYGDVVSHLNQPRREFKIKSTLSGYDMFFVNKIKEFKKIVERKGAKMIFVYPCVPESLYKSDRTIINSVHKALVMANITPSISPSDFVYEDSCFFDTIYHLNAECRNRRTESLVRLINDGK